MWPSRDTSLDQLAVSEGEKWRLKGEDSWRHIWTCVGKHFNMWVQVPTGQGMGKTYTTNTHTHRHTYKPAEDNTGWSERRLGSESQSQGTTNPGGKPFYVSFGDSERKSIRKTEFTCSRLYDCVLVFQYCAVGCRSAWLEKKVMWNFACLNRWDWKEAKDNVF